MAVHSIKVYPYSEAETYFMELLKKVNVNQSSVICRLGALFGTEYNEYIISDGLYKQISEFLRNK